MTNATTIRRSLTDMNAKAAEKSRVWGQYTLVREYAVGTTGSTYYGKTGAKRHLLVMERVVAENGEHKPNTYKVGDLFGVNGACNQQGQHNGRPISGLDTDAVTCEKCAKWLD